MLPDRVSNPRPLTYESGALPIALRGPASDYPTYSFFIPHPKLFLHFGQTVHLKKKMEEKACILEDFFYFDMNPIALRKAKIVYNRVKRKTIVLSRTERSSSLQYFLIF